MLPLLRKTKLRHPRQHRRGQALRRNWRLLPTHPVFRSVQTKTRLCPRVPLPTFDFGADDQTNALLLQDAQTFITGNMARIMAAKHAHDLTANHYQGSWGKWCAAVGISRDTGDRMVSVAAQCGNIQLEGKSILDVQPYCCMLRPSPAPRRWSSKPFYR